MHILDQIPVTFERPDLAVRLRNNPAENVPRELIDLAQALVCARAIFRVADAAVWGEEAVEISGAVFRSRLLRQNLSSIHKVFPYIITVGPELEQAAAAQGDLLMQYYLEEIANIALEKAAAWLAARIEAQYGLGPLSNLSPGSLVDWPLTEQAKLFSIFGKTERLIGVRLTDSMLMIPRKSISGILFPSEEGFNACQLCDRERCPGRKTPFLEP